VDRRTWDGVVTVQMHASGRALFGVAYRIVRDVQTAEDVCQTALAKALQCEGELRQPDRLAGWLHQVVVNESLMVVRRRKLEKGRLSNRAPGPVSTADVAQQVELRESVLAGLAQVDERVRTVVVMRVMEGLSGNEVAEILGCSASEVSRRLHEGMDRLREILI
jgi:RNA polymerase sigma factor (sigma-70 family)